MRCPKCSFISFDVLETCVKCGKNISAAAEALEGTVASMVPPEFLKFEFTETETEEANAESSEFEPEEAFDLGGDDEEVIVDFSPDEGVEKEAVDMEISTDDATDEFTIEADEPTQEDVIAEEPEETGEFAMDIADLAPAEEEVEQEIETVAEEFEIAAEDLEPQSEDPAGQGLQDLKVDIDLEATPAPATEGKVMPSVKTGTALDDFDIDLGDLLPKQ